METTKLIEQRQYEKSKMYNGNLTTVTFQQNYNFKLYGKYFTTIRDVKHKIKVGDICDIILKGKGVKIAKCIGCEEVYFNELAEITILMDTGLNYSDSLDLFKSFGLNVSNFELKVKYCLFESL